MGKEEKKIKQRLEAREGKVQRKRRKAEGRMLACAGLSGLWPNIDASSSDISSWLLSTSVVSIAVPQAGLATLVVHGSASSKL